MSEIVFELCAEGIEACVAAREGGAHRIELCSALSEGGVTPSHALIDAAVRQSGLPVHVLLRPRSGGFVYSDAEFALMEDDLQHAKVLGAQGIVVGVLDPQGKIDGRRMRRIVGLAGDLEVTFHRAFDTLDDLDAALEQVIDCGCRRLLTSGGAPDVVAGADRLRALNEQAAGRIVVAAGGGLRVANAARVAAASGARHFHGSMRRAVGTGLLKDGFGDEMRVDPADVRAVIAELVNGLVPPLPQGGVARE